VRLGIESGTPTQNWLLRANKKYKGIRPFQPIAKPEHTWSYGSFTVTPRSSLALAVAAVSRSVSWTFLKFVLEKS
jgi:hypothetical protein